MLYIAIVRSKLEYASIVRNSISNTDSNKLERMQRKFAALCHKIFLQDIDYHYINILDKLNLQVRRRHIDALFFINVSRGTKLCPSVLEAVDLRVPTRNIRNFPTFSCSSSHCRAATCVLTANSVCKFVDIFSNLYVSLRNVVQSFYFCLFMFFCFIYCIVCFILRADSVIDHRLLSSARK
jgi:hypothetical protein